MVFSSALFLFLFLPVTLAGYFVIRENCRNAWLLAVSLVFFSWSQPDYLWLILLNVVVNYCSGLLVNAQKSLRRPVLAMAMAVNLGILFYYKYFNFVLDSVNKLTGCDFVMHNIILPVGISFFTFQGMSYVIDVYRETVPVQKNIGKAALYIVLFPQLIAGPIVRYQDIAGEIHRRSTSLDDFCYGAERFIIGLSKKAVLANTLAATADAVWQNGALHNSPAVAWGGVVLPTPCRFILTFPDTVIWPSDWEECSDFTFRKISICRIFQKAYRNSGGGGIFPCHPGSGIMCTSLWGVTGGMSTGILPPCFFLPGSGMGRPGILLPGESGTGSLSWQNVLSGKEPAAGRNRRGGYIRAQGSFFPGFIPCW